MWWNQNITFQHIRQSFQSYKRNTYCTATPFQTTKHWNSNDENLSPTKRDIQGFGSTGIHELVQQQLPLDIPAHETTSATAPKLDDNDPTTPFEDYEDIGIPVQGKH